MMFHSMSHTLQRSQSIETKQIKSKNIKHLSINTQNNNKIHHTTQSDSNLHIKNNTISTSIPSITKHDYSPSLTPSYSTIFHEIDLSPRSPILKIEEPEIISIENNNHDICNNIKPCTITTTTNATTTTPIPFSKRSWFKSWFCTPLCGKHDITENNTSIIPNSNSTSTTSVFDINAMKTQLSSIHNNTSSNSTSTSTTPIDSTTIPSNISSSYLGSLLGASTTWMRKKTISCLALTTDITCMRFSYNTQQKPSTQQMNDTLVLNTIKKSIIDLNHNKQMIVFNSNPLVIQHNSAMVSPITHLNYKKENTEIRQINEKNGKPVNINFRHLSLASLAEELIAQPTILHISSHGLLINNEYYLALESGHGKVDLCNMIRLNKLISISPIPKIIVLSACHSAYAADIFIAAGAQHVICIKHAERILDVSSMYFTRFFYAALFNGLSVQQAFDIAVANVDVAIDSDNTQHTTVRTEMKEDINKPMTTVSESSKFMLLPADKDHHIVYFGQKQRKRTSSLTESNVSTKSKSSTKSNKSKSISLNISTTTTTTTTLAQDDAIDNQYFSSRPISTLSLCTDDVHHSPISTPNTSEPNSPIHGTNTSLPPLRKGSSPTIPNNLPTLPDICIGREVEIFNTISLLSYQRLVNQYGPVKYGKTSTALSTAYYLLEREIFENGIFYLSLQQHLGLFQPSAEQQLISYLCLLLHISEKKLKSCTMKCFCDYIKNMDILLILDDCNIPLIYQFILKLLSNTNKLKLLITSYNNANIYLQNMSIGTGFILNCGVVYIHRLSLHTCITLIKSLCSYEMSEKDATQLVLHCNYSAYELRIAIRHLCVQYQIHCEQIQQQMVLQQQTQLLLKHELQQQQTQTPN